MTGCRYVKWRNRLTNVPFPAATCVAACMVALFSPLKAGAVEIPKPSIHEAFHDHPVVTLCIIVLLCLLCAVLLLSRRKIQASERRYRALFQDNGAVMLLIDAESMRILDANPAACAFYGWRPADFLNMPIFDINTSPESVVREIYHDVLNYERRRYRVRHRLASGEEREVEVNSMPYQIDGRDCLLSIIHAITTKETEQGERREQHA